MLLPGTTWLLVDSGQRRIDFLVEAVARLELTDRVAVHLGRAEAIASEDRERFDAVTARGFGPPPVLAECAAGWCVRRLPRMRFDIVLNNLAGLAWTTGRIAMTSDGTPWRPLVHALDIAQAIRCALDAARELVHNQVFNVGEQRAELPGPRDRRDRRRGFPRLRASTFGTAGGDNRSYRVNFDKITRELPGLLL